MIELGRFLRLPPCRRRLLIRAAVLLGLMRAGLWLLPFKLVLRLTKRNPERARPGDGGDLPVGPIIWAVRRASRFVPGATCLTQALVGRVLLARAGHLSEVRIGVRKDSVRGFEAHAWLEHRGEVVLGDLEDLSRYAPMLPLGERP
jgi:hypothetical protein